MILVAFMFLITEYGQSEKKEVGDKGKFIEALLKVINFTKPVIISPSMSGTFSLPFLLRDADNVDKKVSGYIPVAPVIPKDNRERIKDLKVRDVYFSCKFKNQC